jgi:hypothetical protein
MSEPDDPTESTPVTEPTDEVGDVPEVETASDLGPTEVAAPAPVAVAADPVRTVSRRGAGLAMAACLLVGGLLGWLVADASDDDDGNQLVRFGQGADAPPGYPGYPGPMGPGGGPRGGPMGPHGGWEHGPGGHWGEHEVPPWMDGAPDDGRRDDAPGDSTDQDDDAGSPGDRSDD